MRPTVISKVVLFLLGVLFALMLITSCTANYHLKVAKRHLLIAESKGATIKTDSVYRWKTFRVPVRHAEFGNPFVKLITINGKTYTRIQYKDTVIYKNKIRIEIKDSLIYVACPEESIKEKVAIKADTQITPKFSIPWWWWVFVLIAFIGFLAFKLFKR